MADIGGVFRTIGKATGANIPPANKGVVQSPSQRAGMSPAGASAGQAAPSAPGGAGGAGKPFDFNMYMQAVQMAFQDFFSKKLPYFFQNIGPVMKGFPVWWGHQKQDEQAAYGGWVLGSVMMLVGLVLLIVL